MLAAVGVGVLAILLGMLAFQCLGTEKGKTAASILCSVVVGLVAVAARIAWRAIRPAPFEGITALTISTEGLTVNVEDKKKHEEMFATWNDVEEIRCDYPEDGEPVMTVSGWFDYRVVGERHKVTATFSDDDWLCTDDETPLNALRRVALDKIVYA